MPRGHGIIPPMAATPEEPAKRVLTFLEALQPAGGVVAISGGVDSALTLSLVAQAWGPGRTLAATSRSASLPAAELEAAAAQASALGVEHVVLEGAELDIEAFRRNGRDRCFHCKDHLYGRLQRLAHARGLGHVLDGTNADDAGDHRPGMRAARQHGVVSPLLEAGLTKQEVRMLSQARGLVAWDKPAEACLSSRFPYGTEVTEEGLDRVERAERALKAFGFPIVRVRIHDPVARIEVPAEDIARLMSAPLRGQVEAAVRAAGFSFVTVDLQGFRSGRLNEVAPIPTSPL